MIVSLAGLALISMVLSIVLVRVVRRISRRINFLDHPDDHKVHPQPVPYGGGLAIFMAMVLPVLAGTAVLCYVATQGVPAWSAGFLNDVWVHGAGALSRLGQLTVVLVGGLVVMLLGLADDRWKLPATFKLAVQIGIGIAVVLAGVRVTAFVGGGLLGAVLTVVWIVGITNAFNMLDNMDGLSAGVALIVAVILGVVALQSGQFFIAALLAPLVGALGGFLIFNYAPATIYMGDAGSLFVGFALSVISVLLTFHEGSGSFRPVLLPFLVFSVPIYDMVSVVIIRLKAARNPMVGDRQHFSHRLVALGLSDRAAVLASHLLTLGIGLSATLLYLMEQSLGQLITIIQAVVILAVIVIMERARPK